MLRCDWLADVNNKMEFEWIHDEVIQYIISADVLHMVGAKTDILITMLQGSGENRPNK